MSGWRRDSCPAARGRREDPEPHFQTMLVFVTPPHLLFSRASRDFNSQAFLGFSWVNEVASCFLLCGLEFHCSGVSFRSDKFDHLDQTNCSCLLTCSLCPCSFTQKKKVFPVSWGNFRREWRNISK